MSRKNNVAHIGLRLLASAATLLSLETAHAQQEIAPQQGGYAISGNAESGCTSSNGNVYFEAPGAVAATMGCIGTYVQCKNAGYTPQNCPITVSFSVGTWNARLANLLAYVNGSRVSGFDTPVYQELTCPSGYVLGGDYVCRAVGLIDDKNRGDRCSSHGTNPINLGSGNKFQVERDLDATESSPLKFHRFYNSSRPGFIGAFPGLPVPPGIGERWTHTYSALVALNKTPTISTAVVIRPQGRAVYFQLQGANTWVPDADAQDQLLRTVDANGATTGWKLTQCGKATVEEFDASGKLTIIREPSGVTSQLTYSDASTPISIAPSPGLMIGVIDSFGRALAFQYDSSRRIRQLTIASGFTFQYIYDTTGNLTRVVGSDQKTRDYLYEDSRFANALTGIIDENADRSSPTYRTDSNVPRFATFAYDSLGRATQSKHAGEVDKYTIVYNADGSASITDPLGTTRSNGFANVLGVAQFKGGSQACNYCSQGLAAANVMDGQGNVSSSIDFKGNKTCFRYDLSRNLETLRVEGLSSAQDCAEALSDSFSLPPRARRISTQWHPTWKLPARVAEPLRITVFAYNGDAGVSCAPSGASTALQCSRGVQATTDGTGELGFGAAGDGAPRTWSFTYNGRGRTLIADAPRVDVADSTSYSYYTSDDPSGNYREGDLASMTDAKGHVTQFTHFDGDGRLKRMVDPNGMETLLDYFPRGWLKSRRTGSTAAGYETTSYGYDAAGQLREVTAPDGSFVRYTYDAAHRLTDIVDGLGNRIHYTLDPMGNRTGELAFDVTGALVREHTRVIDALNRIWKTIGGTNPSTQITQSGYDNNGNLERTIDALGRTTTRIYDEHNRLVEVRDPFNGAASPAKYEYNGRDNVSRVTDPSGLATLYEYNGHGEALSQTSPDTGQTVFTYDEASNIKSRLDSRNVRTTFLHDALNRVLKVTYPDEAVNYTYDSCANGIGRLCQVADKTGTTSYSYDLQGRVTEKRQGVDGVEQRMRYGYNGAGQLVTVTTPSGRIVEYGYANNRPISLKVNGALVLDGVFYEPFGPNGGWRWGNSTPTAPNFHTRVFDRDFRAKRITSDLPTTAAGARALDRSLVWDDLGRVASATDHADSALNAIYGYDELDRLTSASQGANAWGYSFNGTGDRLASTANAATTTYGYFAGTHQLKSLSGAQTKNYSVDPAGNMVSDGRTTWVYGGNNRPASAGAAAFSINALGQRVKKAGPSGTTRFVYDEAGRLWGEYDDSGELIAETIWLEDIPVAVIK